MSEWMGMSTPPVEPRPELKQQVLRRAFAARRRPRWPVTLAAGVALVVAGAAVWLGVRALGLAREVARLEQAVRGYQDTLSLIRSPGTVVVQVPVTSGGVTGSMTIFADTVSGRWLVTCNHLAPSRPGETYQVWFLTDGGPRSAALMTMTSSDPMLMAVDLPAGVRVVGAAMTIEPEAGSPEPRGPMVFQVRL